MISSKVRLVLPIADVAWTRDMDLGIAPFPGLGIRIDTYAVLNVIAVRVAEDDGGVTCVVGPDDAGAGGITEYGAASFGFAPDGVTWSPGGGSGSQHALSAMLVTSAGGQMWCKQISLPFAPFAGLQLEVGGRVMTVFSVVVKDSYSDVTCLASFGDEDAARLTEEDCVALGFEECVYP